MNVALTGEHESPWGAGRGGGGDKLTYSEIFRNINCSKNLQHRHESAKLTKGHVTRENFVLQLMQRNDGN